MVSPVRGAPKWGANFPELAKKSAANDPVAKNELDHTLQSLDEATSIYRKVAVVGAGIVALGNPFVGLGVIGFAAFTWTAAEQEKSGIQKAIHDASSEAIQTVSRAAKDLHGQTTNLTAQVSLLETEVGALHGTNESLVASCQNLAAATARANAATDQLEKSLPS